MPIVTATSAKLKLGVLAKSVNEKLLDRAVQHSILLERFSKGEVNKIARLMNRKVIPDMIADVERRLKNIGEKSFKLAAQPQSLRRVQQMLAASDKQLATSLQFVSRDVRASMHALALSEAEFATRSLRDAVPFNFDFVTPSPEVLRAVVNARPMNGRLLKDWYRDLTRASQLRVSDVVSRGMVRGQSIQGISRSMRQALNITTRQATVIVRTAVTHVSAHAREETYKDNSEMVKKVQYVATLDDRTSDICISLDGRIFNINEGERPPMHHQCRSTTVPITKSAEELGITGLPEAQRRSMNGKVPAKTTYKEWIKKQPAAVQNKALGKGRAELLRAGKLDPARLVDPKTLKSLTLKQLQQKEGLRVIKPAPVVTKPAPVVTKPVVPAGSAPKGFPSNSAVRHIEHADDFLDESAKRHPSITKQQATDAIWEKQLGKMKITNAEQEAIEQWVNTDGGRLMSKRMRSLTPGKKIPADWVDERALSGLIKRMAPLKEDVIAHRFFNASSTEGAALLKNIKASKSFKLPGFTAVSNVQTSNEAGVLNAALEFFEIRLPKGSKGVLRGFNIDESELLLGHNSSFKFLGSTKLTYQARGAESFTRITHQLEYVP